MWLDAHLLIRFALMEFFSLRVLVVGSKHNTLEMAVLTVTFITENTLIILLASS